MPERTGSATEGRICSNPRRGVVGIDLPCCIHDPLPRTKAWRERVAYCCYCGDGYIPSDAVGRRHGQYAPRRRASRRKK